MGEMILEKGEKAVLLLAILLIPSAAYASAYIREAERSKSLLAHYRDENARLSAELSILKREAEAIKGEAETLRKELGRLQLKRPSAAELRAFLSLDRTDERPYDRYSFVCLHYASQLRANARRAGYNLSFVALNFEASHDERPLSPLMGGHALNGAILADGRHIWIEPQTDDWDEDLEALLGRFFGRPVRVLMYVEIW
ncbi:MAG: hypothetical protein QXG32_00545 [Candidatus Bathyarchaeia archaeon]